MSSGPIWRVAVTVPAESQGFFELALEQLGGAVGSAAHDAVGPVVVEVFLQEEPERAGVETLVALAAAACGLETPDVEIATLPETDWLAENRRDFAPLRAGRFWIHGSHVEEAPPLGSIPLLIEASVAFGTGRHETTRGCLLALQDLSRRMRVRRALDLGCGTAILALAVRRLWPASRVLASDDDPKAVAMARENLALNGERGRVRLAVGSGYRPRELREAGPYDLIVANILARPLMAMAGDLKASLAPGGRAVLSGLLTSQERMVIAPHEARGLRLERRYRLGDWSTLLLRRGSL